MGCPIRKSADIMDICSSPQLIAACHVLPRLWEPRHSPCALIYFLELFNFTNFFVPNMSKNFFDCGARIDDCGLKKPKIENPDSEIKIFFYRFQISVDFRLKTQSEIENPNSEIIIMKYTRRISIRQLTDNSFDFLQKGGVPAAPSGTATLLRLSPSH